MNFAQKVARIYDLKDAQKRLEEEIENLYATLPESQKTGDYAAGRYILRVEDNRRFDATTAAKAVDADTLEKISVKRADATLARRLLSGDDFRKCQKSFGVKRTVVPVTDDE